MPNLHSTNPEIDALIHLLDDPDDTVQDAIRQRLQELGRSAIPQLQHARRFAEEPLRSRISELVHEVHFSDIQQAWAHLMDSPDPSLERGAFLMALYRFPSLDVASYREKLDLMAERVRDRIDAEAGPERAFALSDFMFRTLGFSANRDAYYDPNNSFINWVIDNRTGIPVSLSVVYLLLARRLDLPIFGVNMPAHFIVKYDDTYEEVFIDVYNEGEAFAKDEGIRFLLNADIKPRPHYFKATDERSILLRMVRNLVAIAYQTHQGQMLADLQSLLAPWDRDNG